MIENIYAVPRGACVEKSFTTPTPLPTGLWFAGRAPNINELYAGVAGDAATVNDPCNANIDSNRVACANVPTDGSYQQSDGKVLGKVSGAAMAGYQLKPETG